MVEDPGIGPNTTVLFVGINWTSPFIGSGAPTVKLMLAQAVPGAPTAFEIEKTPGSGVVQIEDPAPHDGVRKIFDTPMLFVLLGGVETLLIFRVAVKISPTFTAVAGKFGTTLPPTPAKVFCVSDNPQSNPANKITVLTTAYVQKVPNR
jgi:hypothetical protein